MLCRYRPRAAEPNKFPSGRRHSIASAMRYSDARQMTFLFAFANTNNRGGLLLIVRDHHREHSLED